VAFFGEPTFFQPIRAFEKKFSSDWLKKNDPPKIHLFFGHVNRVIEHVFPCQPMARAPLEFFCLFIDALKAFLTLSKPQWTIYVPPGI